MPVESCTQSLCDLALRFGEDTEDAGMVSRSSAEIEQPTSSSEFYSALMYIVHVHAAFAYVRVVRGGQHFVWTLGQ